MKAWDLDRDNGEPPPRPPLFLINMVSERVSVRELASSSHHPHRAPFHPKPIHVVWHADILLRHIRGQLTGVLELDQYELTDCVGVRPRRPPPTCSRPVAHMWTGRLEVHN